MGLYAEEIDLGNFFALFKDELEIKLKLESGETIERTTSKGELISLIDKKISIKSKVEIWVKDKKFFVTKNIYLEAPKLDELKLASITTDKKIYQPGEFVRVIIIFPNETNRTVNIKLFKERRLIWNTSRVTDKFGVIILTLEDLTEGEYEVRAELAHKKIICACSFTIISYELSPLRAQLDKFTLAEGKIRAKLRVSLLEKPYTGAVKIGLYCGYCKRIVYYSEATSKGGIIIAEIPFRGHTGPFELRLFTPDGLTASVQLPGTKRREREVRTFSDMGIIAKASLAPQEGFCKFKGMYVSKQFDKDAPIRISDIIGDELYLEVMKEIKKLGLIIYDPVMKEYYTHYHDELKTGEKIRIPIKEPSQVIIAGVVLEESGSLCLKEYYALVFSEPEIETVNIISPAKVMSNEALVKINVKSRESRKAKLIVIALDDRLFRDSEEINIARGYFELITAVNELIDDIKMDWPLRKLLARRSRVRGLMMPTIGFTASALPLALFAPMRFASKSERGAKVNKGVVSSKERRRGRETLSEVAGLLLQMPIFSFQVLEVDTNKEYELKIHVGDELRTIRIEVIAISGYSVIKNETRITIMREDFVKIEAPTYMDSGDMCIIPIHYLASQDGVLIIETFEGVNRFSVKKGSGVVYIGVNGPTEIIVTLMDKANNVLAEAKAVIKKMGEEEIEVSRLEILNPGETISGERILIYPSLDSLVRDVAFSLIKYPYGCAEQTSAKLKGLMLVFKLFKDSNNGELDKVKMLIGEGIQRMKKFYKHGIFSLWEDTDPNPSVTIKVLKNLSPAMTIDDELVKPLKEMITEALKQLKKLNIKDSELAELDKGLIEEEIKTIEDSAHILIALKDNMNDELYKKALIKIEKEAIHEDNYVKWKGKKAWAGDIEATCLVLRALIATGERKDLVDKGMKYVLRRLVGGMLYSTSDTAALLDMIFEARSIFPMQAEAIVDGKETVILSETVGKKIKALSKLIVRIDEKKKINELDVGEGNLIVRIMTDKPEYKVGDVGKIIVEVKGDIIIPIIKVYLPPGLIAMKGGANIQAVSGARSPFVIEVIAVRGAKGKVRAVARDMYSADKVGIATPLKLRINQ